MEKQIKSNMGRYYQEAGDYGDQSFCEEVLIPLGYECSLPESRNQEAWDVLAEGQGLKYMIQIKTDVNGDGKAGWPTEHQKDRLIELAGNKYTPVIVQYFPDYEPNYIARYARSNKKMQFKDIN